MPSPLECRLRDRCAISKKLAKAKLTKTKTKLTKARAENKKLKKESKHCERLVGEHDKLVKPLRAYNKEHNEQVRGPWCRPRDL